MKFSKDTALFLAKKKNLLAFSAGIDSSALFFILRENNILFDIAIVDYGIREESKQEVKHAFGLAKKYDIKCYSVDAPRVESHFEQNARNFRYDFFEKIIKKYDYDNLLTAHQLNDQLEWLLMRLSKGSGLTEMIGLESATQRNGYTMLRPLLKYSKHELLEYLKENDYPYFVDKSNTDENYERNRFRKSFSDPFIERYKDGIERSFEYLKKDKKLIESGFRTVYKHKKLYIIKLEEHNLKARAVDLALKKLGYLLSSSQRREINARTSLVVGGKWAIEEIGDILYIAPYLTITMPKTFKEQCRNAKIPSKVRPYLYQEEIEIKEVKSSIY